MTRTALSLSDEWETDQEMFEQLCYAYDIHPGLDACATLENHKCDYWYDIEDDALQHNWDYTEGVWCNPPHSKTKQFVIKAHQQWFRWNINILMIIPANSICTKYAEKYIKGSAEFHPIHYRPRFLRDGKPAKDPARNSYFVVIWRKQNKHETNKSCISDACPCLKEGDR